ncbi:MAG: hypothetical protein DMF35_02885 [Verrucomicrobia bacterium]|nr:MAG: hypothetical protein DMF35_02885 [Verrucomicrobiota bacterium]
MNKIKYIVAVLIAIAGMGLQQAKAFESDLNAGNPAIACLGLQQAKAVTMYSLTVPNAAISGFPPPYGEVSVSVVGSIATITFTADNTAAFQYLFGNGGSVNAGTGFTPGGFTQDVAGNVDGLGSFNLRIKSFDGFTHASDTITFTLTNTSGTWATQADVVTLNASGFDAAAHIFVTTSPANASNSALATGFAGEGPGTVPDGGTTVMLLGAALGALGMARRFLMG